MVSVVVSLEVDLVSIFQLLVDFWFHLRVLYLIFRRNLLRVVRNSEIQSGVSRDGFKAAPVDCFCFPLKYTVYIYKCCFPHPNYGIRGRENFARIFSDSCGPKDSEKNKEMILSP